MVSLSQTVFSNSLQDTLPTYAPGVNAQVVIAAGSTKMRGLGLDKAQLAGVLKAYAVALDRIFYLCAGISVASFGLSWWMGWTDVRPKKENEGKVNHVERGSNASAKEEQWGTEQYETKKKIEDRV